MKIGCIGTGKMGGPVARNLIRAGNDVLVYKRSQHGIEDLLETGSSVRITGSLKDLACCEVVFTCLPLPVDVETTMSGPGGLMAHMEPGTIYVDMSTIDPTTSHRLEKSAQNRGIGFLQCTLGKTPAHAEKAEEPLFIGGNRECFDRLAGLWPVIGSPAHYLGTVDAACAIKLVSNMIGMANLVVLSEGLHVLHKAGIDLNTSIELLQDTGARSFQMDVRGPWMVKRDYEPRFGLDLALKDVRLGCGMADSWAMDMPTMKTILEIFNKASASGHGEKDCCVIHEVIS
jgi:3-hydroxyisobutyrate dehydrogenase-like beta-hydroxyacid dehydrogenase